MNEQAAYKLITIILSIGLLVITGCHHHGSRRYYSTRDLNNVTDKIVKDLELNQSQERQLDAILSSLEEKKDELSRGHELVDEISKQLASEDLDEVYLRKRTSEVFRELEEVSKDFITQLAAFHRTLASQQKSKLAKLLETRKGRRRWSSRYH